MVSTLNKNIKMKHIGKNINDFTKKIDILKKDILLEFFKYRKSINPFKNLNKSTQIKKLFKLLIIYGNWRKYKKN